MMGRDARNEVITQLNEAIRVNALRLVEINNRIQSVNRGGVYRLPQPVCAYIARQMGKRDAAKELQTVLHSARKALYSVPEADSDDPFGNMPCGDCGQMGKDHTAETCETVRNFQ